MCFHYLYVARKMGRTEMKTDFPIILETSHAVSHIENDLHLPGNILFADGGALKTSLYGETWTVVGFFAHDGYVEGVWQAARFSWITGFFQLSAFEVLVVDKWNHCLRVVNRITNSTSYFAGSARVLATSTDIQLCFPFQFL